MNAPFPPNETERLATLRTYNILDTQTEQAFEGLALLASQICQMPVALISLVDAERQWLKSKVGLGLTETPREESFCAWTILHQEFLVVPDALEDERFANNRLVVSDPGIRFYAGAPLRAADGNALGAICVIDYKPRELKTWQLEGLRLLAQQTMMQMDFRRANIELVSRVSAQTAELLALNDRLNAELEKLQAVEEELYVRNRMLVSFFDVTPAGLGVLDAELRYVHINETLARMNNKSVKEHLGRTVSQVLPELAPFAEPMLQRILDTGEPVLGIEHSDHPASFDLTPDAPQKKREWNFSYFPVPGEDGKPKGVGTVCLDVTARVEAERAVRESVEQFQGTFDQAAVGFGHASLEGRWLRVNNKMCEITGYSSKELLERDIRGLAHPDDVDSDKDKFEQLLAGTIPNFSQEKRYIRRDGATVWVETTVSLLRGLNGEPKYFITVIEDISERKRLEEQLRQSQKMESIGTLAGGVAHDFNNLLTAINGNAAFLLEDIEEGSPLRIDVLEIKKAADRAAMLTRQLLAFSRKQMLKPKILNLNGIVRDMEKMFRRLIGEDVELSVELQPNLRRVEIDPGQIEQVVMNLCVNSRDAMPDGGKLIITTRNTTLGVDDTSQHVQVPAGDYVVLSVTDTGCGMDAETQARIFEPFYTTKEVGKGTGLGLSMAHGIVRQSGGDISVYSKLGHGTTFNIYLPVANGRQIEDAEKEASLPHNVRGTILLAEDEEVVRKTAARVLKRCGYNVLEAGNGREALALADAFDSEIDLVLTDAVMPEMSGSELVEHIKQARPLIRVIYMSGYTEDVVVRHGVFHNEVAFIQKPWSPDDLACLVKEVLNANANTVTTVCR